MYLIKYLKERIKVWYLDKKDDQYSKLEKLNYFTNNHYVQEELRSVLLQSFHSTDLIDNTIKIKYDNFENVWIKGISDTKKLVVEIFTIIDDEEVTIINENKINHQLFFDLISSQYLHRYKKKLPKSKWKKRKENFYIMYHFFLKERNLDLSTFDSKNIIEINLINLEKYHNELILNDQKLSRFVFFKALENEELYPLLKNYSLVFNQKDSEFLVEPSHFKRITESNKVCQLFLKYSFNKKHVEYLNDFNKDNTINLIMDYTEATLEFPKHNDSYYIETFKSRIRNKNIYTYFMFLRLALLGKIETLPDEILESVDEIMVEDFDKITVGLLEICKNPDLQYSFIYMNDYKKRIELNNWDLGYEHEDIKQALYKVINNAPNRNTTRVNNNLGSVLLELINSSVFKIHTISDATEVINHFHLFHNLKKYKLRKKLENKLVSKESIKKEKVKKI